MFCLQVYVWSFGDQQPEISGLVAKIFHAPLGLRGRLYIRQETARDLVKLYSLPTYKRLCTSLRLCALYQKFCNQDGAWLRTAVGCPGCKYVNATKGQKEDSRASFANVSHSNSND